MPTLRGRGRGDIFVEIRVEVPKKLDKEERKLVEKLLELHNNKRKK